MLKHDYPTYQTGSHGRNDSSPFESIAPAGADYPQFPEKNMKKYIYSQTIKIERS